MKENIAASEIKGNELLKRYEETIDPGNTVEKAGYADILQYRETCLRRRTEVIDAMLSGDSTRMTAARLRIEDGGDVIESEDAYADALKKHSQFLIRWADKTQERSRADAGRAQLTILMFSLFAAIVGFVLAILISRQITKPLAAARECISLFAKGDLRTSFNTKGKDEVARISQDLQGVTEMLGEIMGGVNNASDEITGTAHDLSSMVQDANTSMGELRSSIEVMGTNLEALASAGQEVNASVEEVAAGAQTTAEKGTNIAQQVGRKR